MNLSGSTRVTIGEVRFSYLHVWEPSQIGMDQGKYSVSLIIPKNNTQALALIDCAIKAAAAEGAAKLGASGTYRRPLRDGDAERPDDEAYRGCYFLNAKSNRQPGLVDSYKQPIIDQNQLQSGDWGYACIRFFAYNNSGNKGISASLEHLMKTRDGESLGGGITTDAAFADVPVLPPDPFTKDNDPFAEERGQTPGMPNLG